MAQSDAPRHNLASVESAGAPHASGEGLGVVPQVFFGKYYLQERHFLQFKGTGKNAKNVFHRNWK